MNFVFCFLSVQVNFDLFDIMYNLLYFKKLTSVFFDFI